MPNTRHTDILLTRLERVLDIGVAEITSIELVTLFEQERLTVTIWRQIHRYWTDLLEETRHVQSNAKNCKLLVGEASGVWVFAYGLGLQVGENSWFRDVREMAKIDYDKSNWDKE